MLLWPCSLPYPQQQLSEFAFFTTVLHTRNLQGSLLAPQFCPWSPRRTRGAAGFFCIFSHLRCRKPWKNKSATKRPSSMKCAFNLSCCNFSVSLLDQQALDPFWINWYTGSTGTWESSFFYAVFKRISVIWLEWWGQTAPQSATKLSGD